MSNTTRFLVPGISCQHCVAAITSEVSAVPGVTSVEVSIDDKTVTVAGEAGAAAIEAAIEEAGYDIDGETVSETEAAVESEYAVDGEAGGGSSRAC